mmetsp:Transcript_40699/g.95611  ORF Transcript_40699/g.95611 Transcript_40699/m.95611 type:complete len:200 (+) Transcript_40699:42-641(+)
MPPRSMLFVGLALLRIAPAAGRICNTGNRTTYSGDCTGLTDANLFSTSTCFELGVSTGEYCTTYSYTATAAGCTTTTVIGSCSLSSTACNTWNSLFGDRDGFQCETCDTDNCNPDTHISSEDSDTDDSSSPIGVALDGLGAAIILSIAIWVLVCICVSALLTTCGVCICYRMRCCCFANAPQKTTGSQDPGPAVVGASA